MSRPVPTTRKVVGILALGAGMLLLLVCPPAAVGLIISSAAFFKSSAVMTTGSAALLFLLYDARQGYRPGEGRCSLPFSAAGILVHEFSPSLCGQQIAALTRDLKRQTGALINQSQELFFLVRDLEAFDSWLFDAKAEEGQALANATYAAGQAWLEFSRRQTETEEQTVALAHQQQVLQRIIPECQAHYDALLEREKSAFAAVLASARVVVDQLEAMALRGRHYTVKVQEMQGLPPSA